LHKKIDWGERQILERTPGIAVFRKKKENPWKRKKSKVPKQVSEAVERSKAVASKRTKKGGKGNFSNAVEKGEKDFSLRPSRSVF